MCGTHCRRPPDLIPALPMIHLPGRGTAGGHGTRHVTQKDGCSSAHDPRAAHGTDRRVNWFAAPLKKRAPSFPRCPTDNPLRQGLAPAANQPRRRTCRAASHPEKQSPASAECEGEPVWVYTPCHRTEPRQSPVSDYAGSRDRAGCSHSLRPTVPHSPACHCHFAICGRTASFEPPHETGAARSRASTQPSRQRRHPVLPAPALGPIARRACCRCLSVVHADPATAPPGCSPYSRSGSEISRAPPTLSLLPKSCKKTPARLDCANTAQRITNGRQTPARTRLGRSLAPTASFLAWPRANEAPTVGSPRSPPATYWRRSAREGEQFPLPHLTRHISGCRPSKRRDRAFPPPAMPYT